VWSVDPSDEPAGWAPGAASVSSIGTRPGWRGRLVGLRARPTVYASVWLVYLLVPLADAWREPRPLWRWIGVTALLVFVGAFVVGASQVRAARRGRRGARALVLGLLALMGVLLVLAAPAVGDASMAGIIYIAVLGVMVLPPRWGWSLAVLMALASEVLPRVVPGWHTDNFFAFQVLVATFAAWGVMAVVARNAELIAAREEIARLAVADERARMSRDLHDILGHSLTVITVKAELAGRLAEHEGAPRALAEIADVERLAREALADVRSTVGGMRGVTLAGELAGARTALEAAGIRAQLPTVVEQVPAPWRELFAWTVREGVTNVVRHSGAGQCVVRLAADAVEVEDDGCGLACDPAVVPAAARTGHGLSGLRERAAHLGARMVVDPRGGAGFVLRVEVPT
jgi:two-component system sensor histidine kinase DesK